MGIEERGKSKNRKTYEEERKKLITRGRRWAVRYMVKEKKEEKTIGSERVSRTEDRESEKRERKQR